MLKNLLFFLFFAQQLYALSLEECQHILLRTSFDIKQKELQTCLEFKDYNSYIFSYISNTQKSSKDELLDLKLVKREKNLQTAKEFRTELRAEQMELKTWYIKKLLTTKQPLQEKMVLFWHNHFTSSLQKVRQAKLIYQQNILFRKYALGNFKEFVHSIIRDPAMLIYLDNRINKKSHPNENLARELLELFTLGEGHYTEKDIKALAKGLTGYSLDKNLEFKYKRGMHDRTKKTFLGKTGNFTADDMIDILFENEQVSLYITTKLYKEFVSYEADQQTIKELAKIFRDSDYELSTLMFAMLTSKEFRDKRNYNTMVKSPIELTIGTLRSFNYTSFEPKIILRFLNILQQSLFNPPNVKGFKGELSWVNANTLIDRQTFLNRLVNDEQVYSTSLKNEELTQLLNTQTTNMADKNRRRFIRKLLLNPTYQLK